MAYNIDEVNQNIAAIFGEDYVQSHGLSRPSTSSSYQAAQPMQIQHVADDDADGDGELSSDNESRDTSDYHGQMNSVNFEKWATGMLIPNLPQNSVVVMDNAPYHSVQENKVPTKSSTKPIMLEWLTKNNVEASIRMRKDELFHLVQLHKPIEKSFKIDEFIRSHGHVVVRLPPYMCDLNPIELAWAKVKRIVRHHNVTSDLSLKRLKEVTELAISQVTEEDWRGFDDHVIILEENYWQRDGLIEDTIDRFVIEISDGEDSDTDSTISAISESD
ncbi:uncharacterized protein LOC124641450 [Helicoverpa zea]|uniref:uncharacterized protein LOC124641450 n=1 Tax=Helicoverpa zea TaxID=7113 RepID=UPI001F58C1D4|nr:uncharacterized protein LOC124641450 [Helicoverpa zea]